MVGGELVYLSPSRLRRPTRRREGGCLIHPKGNQVKPGRWTGLHPKCHPTPELLSPCGVPRHTDSRAICTQASTHPGQRPGLKCCHKSEMTASILSFLGRLVAVLRAEEQQIQSARVCECVHRMQTMPVCKQQTPAGWPFLYQRVSAKEDEFSEQQLQRPKAEERGPGGSRSVHVPGVGAGRASQLP